MSNGLRDMLKPPITTWNVFYQHAKNHWMRPAQNNVPDEGSGVDDRDSFSQLALRHKRADEEKQTFREGKLSKVDAGRGILSHGVDKEPAQSLAPGGTEPHEPIVHEARRFSLSYGSGSSNAHSVATTITTPESEEDSIDAGIADTKNMDHILDAARYFSELDQLELQTAQILPALNLTRWMTVSRVLGIGKLRLSICRLNNFVETPSAF